MTSVMPRSKAQPQPYTGDIKALERRLAKAKTSLILEHPFVGTIALNMQYIVTEDVPTAATNGKYIKFNPSFIGDLCDEQLKFLVAHECFHPMFEHNYRRGGRDHGKWNRAADYVINHHLVEEKIGKFIDGGCLDPNIYRAGGGTSDGIYNILPDQDDDNGGGGEAYDDCEDGGATPAEQAQAQAEMKVAVAQAAQAAKMMGKLSANMERLVGEILTPKVNWVDVLRHFMQRATLNERSYQRPNRRFFSRGHYLPGPSGQTMGPLVFAVDCSGSITDEQIAQAAGEISAVFEDFTPAALHVVYFDSEVCHYDVFERGEQPVIKPHGGGGTAFSPVFQHIAEHDIEPSACVFLTDLYCSDFGPEPEYPVLWISDGAQKAPFGEVTKWG